jgi:hypothetical protein
MRPFRVSLGSFLLVSLAGAPAFGQSISSGCPAGAPLSQQRIVQDVCQKTLDVFDFLAPQLGTLMAGGNATLGQGSALGGPGRFSLGIRANVINARIPRVDRITPSITGAQASDYEVDNQVAPLPAIDLAIGVFGGFPLGATNVLALDALASASYLPSFTSDDVEVSVNGGALRLGFGGRVGLIQESIVTPGVSVTYLRRNLPLVDVVGTSGSDELAVRDLEVKTDAWRVVAGKNLVFFSVAAGAGRDTYRSEAAVIGRVNRAGITATTGPIDARQRITRTNIFADVSLNFSVLKIVGEIGRVSGGDVARTFNTFSGKKPDDALTFGSVGVRFSF